MDQEQLQIVINLTQELARREAMRKTNIINYLYPDEDIHMVEGVFPHGHKIVEAADDMIIYGRKSYPKHVEFWDKGADYQQRYLVAGNRTGKTLCGAMEVSFHLTGLYPSYWKGHRFATCNDWWAAADSSDTVRDNIQKLFIGKVGEFGSGLIPKDTIDFDTLKDAKKASTGVGSVRVRHVTGGWSNLTFKSYEQGRDKFQSSAVSVFLDEEPPSDVYGECLIRTMTGKNILICTFTPLSGITPFIEQLLPDGDVAAEGDIGNGKWLSRIGMDDVLHLDEGKITNILAAFPDWQRKARRLGLPVLEEGAIFPYSEETYTIQPIAIPDHWAKAYGMDVGSNTAAVMVAHDRDANIYYVYAEHFGKDMLPMVHASIIKGRTEKWMTGAIDTSAHSTNQTDQQNIYDMLEREGLKITNAEKTVEAGIYKLQGMLMQGQLKVFSTCTGLLKEMRSYRRKEDKKTGRVTIVKVADHHIDSLRYALMTEGIFKTAQECKPKKPYNPYGSGGRTFVG